MTRVIECGTAVVVVFIIGCSGGGGDDGGDGGGSLASIRERVRAHSGAWVDSIAETFVRQLAAGAGVDVAQIRRDVEGEASSLSRYICGELQENAKLVKRSSGAETQVIVTIDEAVMTGIASRPEILPELGMTTWGQWPRFMLKEPAPANDALVEGIPGALRERLKPEFVNESGGLKLPTSGDDTYEEFQQWYQFDKERDNRLFERASSTSLPVRTRVSDCLEGISGSES